MRGIKKGNEYQDLISGGLYEKFPKAVLAAIVVSLLTCGGDYINTTDIDAELLREWQALFDNGIVPQKPIEQKEK